MEKNKNLLMRPFTLGKLQLSNHIVMAPMTRCRAIGNEPNALMAEYYAQRSSAGLIISEGTAPSANGLGYARTPGLFTSGQVEAWKAVTGAVHAKGGKIFVQLMHVGRIAHSANMPAGARILAPSAVNAQSDMWTDTQGMQKTETPHEMTADEITATRNEFVQAAINAIEAGFDGVELHSANGYLLEQFLNPHTNTRTDAYGGSVAKRARFLLETAEATGKAIGFDKVGVRISPFNTFNGMPAYDDTTVAETYLYLAAEFSRLQVVYLHVSEFAASQQGEKGQKLLEAIGEEFTQTLIVNGGYDKKRAEAVLERHPTRLVAFGSSFIANPDLPYRLENDLAWNQADMASFYTADAKGYTDYPVLA